MILTEIERLVTRTNLAAWYAASDLSATLADGASVATWPDKSGNARDLLRSTNKPTFAANIVNGYPAINFDGTMNPLTYTGTVSLKHVFVVASYADAAFPASGGAGEYAGLITGVGGGSIPILIGFPSSTKFYDNNYDAIDTFHYYKRGYERLETDMQCSFSNTISVFEDSFAGGWGLDGIQIGKDRNFANRLWKGRVVEILCYTGVLTDTERRDIYEYLAMKYLLYKQNSAGLDVWPFQADWGDVLGKDKRVLSSTAVSGANKSRSKTSAKRAFAPKFSSRFPEEYDTAEAFWDAKYPGTHFIYRDYTTATETDSECRFVSGISKTREDYRDTDYEWQAVQV